MAESNELAAHQLDELKRVYQMASGSLGERHALVLARESAAAMVSAGFAREAAQIRSREASLIGDRVIGSK